jgi:hypothetical protein
MTGTSLKQVFGVVVVVAVLFSALPASGAPRAGAARVQISESGMLSRIVATVQEWMGGLVPWMTKAGPHSDPNGSSNSSQTSQQGGEPGEAGPHMDPNG